MQTFIPSFFSHSKMLYLLLIWSSLSLLGADATSNCKNPADIIFALDRTISLGSDAFHGYSKPHTIHIQTGLKDTTRFRTAAYMWGTSIIPVFNLTSTLTIQEKLNLLSGMAPDITGTNYDQAIVYALSAFTDPTLPKRKASRFLIVLTDGVDERLQPNNSQSMIKNRITPFAITINGRTHGYSLQGLSDTIALGDSSNVFDAGTLDKLLEKLHSYACTGPQFPDSNQTIKGTVTADDPVFYCFDDVDNGTTIDFNTDGCSVRAYFSYRHGPGSMIKDQYDGEVDDGAAFYPNEVYNPTSHKICVMIRIEDDPKAKAEYDFNIRFLPGDPYNIEGL